MNNRLMHVGIHDSLNKNAGDTLLFEEVRRLFDQAYGPSDWVRRQLWDHLDRAEAADLSREADAVVVGGGGLLLRDQKGADIGASGWQWNSSVDAVRALDVPLIVFAIGYNRFRGQEEFDPVFTDHINAVVDEAAFVGLRNQGSIDAVRRYLPEDRHDRLHLQPCPTTVAWQLHDHVPPTVIDHARSGRRILRFNVAFDRPEMRFGADGDRILTDLATAMGHAAATGWDVRVTCHKDLDLQVLPHLDAQSVDYRVDDLTDAEPAAIVDAYARCDLALGLRGHAQMVPFGLRVPILSVISHDKMGWFLDDVGHPEWGIEVGAADLADRLCDGIDDHAARPEVIRTQLAAAQEGCWERTVANMAVIGDRLGRTTHLVGAGTDGKAMTAAVAGDSTRC